MAESAGSGAVLEGGAADMKIVPGLGPREACFSSQGLQASHVPLAPAHVAQRHNSGVLPVPRTRLFIWSGPASLFGSLLLLLPPNDEPPYQYDPPVSSWELWKLGSMFPLGEIWSLPASSTGMRILSSVPQSARASPVNVNLVSSCLVHLCEST